MHPLLRLIPMSLVATLIVAIAASPAYAQSDRDAVLSTIQTFLRGLRTGDTTLMNAQLDSVTRITLLRPSANGTRVVVMSGAEFIAAVTRPGQPPIDEPIRNPVVTVDGDLATVWAEYQVRVNGQVSHCGYDAFHLARLGGRWKIVNVSDTFRREGCGAPWPDTASKDAGEPAGRRD